MNRHNEQDLGGQEDYEETWLLKIEHWVRVGHSNLKDALAKALVDNLVLYWSFWKFSPDLWPPGYQLLGYYVEARYPKNSVDKAISVAWVLDVDECIQSDILQASDHAPNSA